MEATHGPAGKEMIIKSVTCEICKKKLKTKRLLARHKFKGKKVEKPVIFCLAETNQCSARLTNGSGSGKSKNMRLQIRILNTGRNRDY
jgi:hypothetical protein